MVCDPTQWATAGLAQLAVGTDRPPLRSRRRERPTPKPRPRLNTKRRDREDRKRLMTSLRETVRDEDCGRRQTVTDIGNAIGGSGLTALLTLMAGAGHGTYKQTRARSRKSY